MNRVYLYMQPFYKHFVQVFQVKNFHYACIAESGENLTNWTVALPMILALLLFLHHFLSGRHLLIGVLIVSNL